MPDVQIKGNLNKFYDVARKDIASLIGSAAVDSAVIYNDTEQDITFYAYNYIDNVYWVSAMKARVAPGNHGEVAASGKFFKIHPNDKKDEEFLVAPKKAYVYHGPGKLETV